VIAPLTIEALTDVARSMGFELAPRDGLAVPLGIDFEVARARAQYALLRGDVVEFDGTARECSAFLIGWRDLRSSMLGALRAIDTQVMPEMSGRTRCGARDAEGRSCLARAGHEGQHSALLRWEEPWRP
jgi:hypothetical protein